MIFLNNSIRLKMSNIIKINKPANYVRFITLKRFYNENKRKYKTETLGEFTRMISKMGDCSIFELLMINTPVKILFMTL